MRFTTFECVRSVLCYVNEFVTIISGNANCYIAELEYVCIYILYLSIMLNKSVVNDNMKRDLFLAMHIRILMFVRLG